LGRWNTTGNPGSGDLDTGILGEIELVDAATDEVRNFRIGVQSKATEVAGAARPRRASSTKPDRKTSTAGWAATSRCCWCAVIHQE